MPETPSDQPSASDEETNSPVTSEVTENVVSTDDLTSSGSFTPSENRMSSGELGSPNVAGPVPGPSALSPVHEFEIDLASFLPDGSSLDDEDREEPGRQEGSVGQPPAQEPASEPVDLTVLTQIEADLSAVDRALTALDDDSYGRCDSCGEQIEADRLQVNPVGRQCGRHLEPTNS